jgi:hypothetical protein
MMFMIQQVHVQVESDNRLHKGLYLEHHKLRIKNYAKLSKFQLKLSSHGGIPPSSLVRESCSSKSPSMIKLKEGIKL